MIDFPTWFSSGCYGGLACCMCAIAVNALYTTLSKRGTTRQLAGAIVTCVISALFILPALLWYNLRFVIHQETPPVAEVDIALTCIALCGWLLPLGTTTAYCLFGLPRSSNTAFRIPSQGKLPQVEQRNKETSLLPPPRYQPGVAAPFAYEDEAPWGWLEYRSGNFQGQRLSLKRTIAILGRDEDCDIWLDDDMASRYHAELAWSREQAYLTDCGSLNGVLCNGQRVHGSILLADNDTIAIGTHHFLFIRAEHKIDPRDDDDPLSHHTWRSTRDLFTESTNQEILGQPLEPDTQRTPVTLKGGALTFCDGQLAGRTIMLDQPALTIGRAPNCQIAINDVSLAYQHAQFLSRDGDNYVQDLSQQNSITVNSKVQTGLCRLQPGDIIGIGNLHLIYVVVSSHPQTSHPDAVTPPHPGIRSGPLPLRLPSRQKEF